jgi:predicted phage terminase large subunit-like protein
MATAEIATIKPQPGPQEIILSTPADIGIIGGSVYGGKTWSLIIEPIRHVKVSEFSFVILRREMPDITNPGGLWDESEKWYPLLHATPRTHVSEWVFPSGATGKFGSIPYEKDLTSWLGSQICLLIMDQLETFTEKMFWYMVHRNRSMCGVRPYMRASANPVPPEDPTGGWLNNLLQWWIDAEGWAIPQRSGTIRWLLRVEDSIKWSTAECPVNEYPIYAQRKEQATQELEKLFPGKAILSNGESAAKSITFVLARLQDNLIGRRLDPAYEANVRALPLLERERLLGGDRGGNWNVRPEAGKVFNRAWFEIVEAAPVEVQRVRAWDKAGTQGDGDWSAGVRIAKAGNGLYYVEEVTRGQWGSMSRNAVIRQTAAMDGVEVEVALEQEPGSGGKESAEISIRELAGYIVHAQTASGSKYVRSSPLAAQVQAGNVKLVKGDWNKAFIDELHGFTGADGGQDDQVDAAANAFNRLALRPGPMQMWGGGVQPKDPFEGTEKEAPKEHDPAILEAIAQTGFYWPGR